MDSTTDSDPITPDDFQSWLDYELKALAKALELRAEEAKGFVEDFASGRITSEEAQRRMDRYIDRWGDSPIPGVVFSEHLTTEEIRKLLDGASSGKPGGRIGRHEKGFSR